MGRILIEWLEISFIRPKVQILHSDTFVELEMPQVGSQRSLTGPMRPHRQMSLTENSKMTEESKGITDDRLMPFGNKFQFLSGNTR